MNGGKKKSDLQPEVIEIFRQAAEQETGIPTEYKQGFLNFKIDKQMIPTAPNTSKTAKKGKSAKNQLAAAQQEEVKQTANAVEEDISQREPNDWRNYVI